VRAGDVVVTREGTGAGSGFGNDHGEAHESAIKEAETDAMKRALMTFGNPFGLALYDKDKANVGHDEPPPRTGRAPSEPPDLPPPLGVPVPMNAEGSDSDWKLWATRDLPARLKASRSAEEVDDVIRANSDALDRLKAVSKQAYDGLMRLQVQLVESHLANRQAAE
jgi:DNA repair and recombination protein RAD52